MKIAERDKLKRYWLPSGLCLIMLFCSGTLMGQVGGNFSPLQNSVHTYSIIMDDEAYIQNWGIYAGGTTQLGVERDTAIALVEGTHYRLVQPVWDDGVRSYFRVQFYTAGNGPTALGNYIIGYKETTSGDNSCITAVIQAIQVYGPFDADVALDAGYDPLVCPDESGNLISGSAVSQTTIKYVVETTYPRLVEENGYVEDQTWSFDFHFNVVGENSGESATIASIFIDGVGLSTTTTLTPGTSSYNYDGFSVDPSQTTPVVFTIVYNDVLGVNQNISFSIDNIRGAYQEPDIDEATGNSISHTIYSMPAVGDITAWN